MIATILTAFFIMAAAFFKAVADTLADHYATSIFKNKDPKFWDKSISWKYVGYFRFWFIKSKFHPDGWHISNSLMIVCFVAFGICTWFAPHFTFNPVYIPVIVFLAFVGYGMFFNATFNTFYDHILKAKK